MKGGKNSLLAGPLPYLGWIAMLEFASAAKGADLFRRCAGGAGTKSENHLAGLMAESVHMNQAVAVLAKHSWKL